MRTVLISWFLFVVWVTGLELVALNLYARQAESLGYKRRPAPVGDRPSPPEAKPSSPELPVPTPQRHSNPVPQALAQPSQIVPPSPPTSWDETLGPRVVVVNTPELAGDAVLQSALSQLSADQYFIAKLFVLGNQGELVAWSTDARFDKSQAFGDGAFREPFGQIVSHLARTKDPNPVVIVWANRSQPDRPPESSPHNPRKIDVIWLNAPERRNPDIEQWFISHLGECTHLYDSALAEQKIRDLLSAGNEATYK